MSKAVNNLKGMDDVKKLQKVIEQYDSVREKVAEILGWNDWDIHAMYLTHNDELDRDEISVEGPADEDGWGIGDHGWVPISWLVLNGKELKKAQADEERRERLEEQRKEKERFAQEYAREEAWERAEYERLREKFERYRSDIDWNNTCLGCRSKIRRTSFNGYEER